MPSIAPIEKQPRIIECGAVRMTPNGIIVSELSQLLDPGFIISEDITKITGIKPEDLVGKPKFAEYLPQLKTFFAGAEMLIAHNLPFDQAMLKYELDKTGCKDFPWPAELVDTAAEYTALMGFRPHLRDVYERIMFEPLAQTHRALDDVKAIVDILIKDRFFVKIGLATGV